MIYDARPRVNAEVNRLRGGGYEDCGAGGLYANCEIQFCNIDNIHEVRTAYEKMCALAYQGALGKDNNAQVW